MPKQKRADAFGELPRGRDRREVESMERHGGRGHLGQRHQIVHPDGERVDLRNTAGGLRVERKRRRRRS